ncbi:MAG TPA: sugar ABC transporter permease [Chloroflexota bacterium]|nr:sugar ABC transporter permease [Chloroflexota bacterium]
MLASLSRGQRKALQGYLYTSPWTVGLVVFVIGPMVASLYLSFTSYSITSQPRFVGIQNYIYMLTGDELFWGSVLKTLYFAGGVVLVGLTGSLACALLLNTGLRGSAFYRTAFFIPSLTPIVALALIWAWVLQPRYGVVNGALAELGMAGPGWLTDPAWAIPGLLLMNLWGTIGGSRMVIFLAGLQGVPQELYDAAHVDGASGWQRFWAVTLPMLSPTIFFNLVLGIIGGLKVFAAAYVTTDGGPAYATWFYLIHLFTQAFRFLEMGYASALAWFFFAVVLALTLIQFGISRRWVYYEGER